MKRVITIGLDILVPVGTDSKEVIDKIEMVIKEKLDVPVMGSAFLQDSTQFYEDVLKQQGVEGSIPE